MCRDFFPNLTDAIREKEGVPQYCTHLVALGSKYESHRYIFVTCQPKLKASTRRIFSLLRWQLESTSTNPHTDESQGSPFLRLNHHFPLQRKEAILLIYKYPDYPTILKNFIINNSQLKAKAHPAGVRMRQATPAHIDQQDSGYSLKAATARASVTIMENQETHNAFFL